MQNLLQTQLNSSDFQVFSVGIIHTVIVWHFIQQQYNLLLTSPMLCYYCMLIFQLLRKWALLLLDGVI